ncbi:MAG: hypothetical protein WCV70_02050 [Patescibacteria group bacterium]|jgi:hypothetical protein
MGDLEERFFSEKGKTLITADDENAAEICEVLKKGITRGQFIQRGGMPSNYLFSLDLVY